MEVRAKKRKAMKKTVRKSKAILVTAKVTTIQILRRMTKRRTTKKKKKKKKKKKRIPIPILKTLALRKK